MYRAWRDVGSGRMSVSGYKLWYHPRMHSPFSNLLNLVAEFLTHLYITSISFTQSLLKETQCFCSISWAVPLFSWISAFLATLWLQLSEFKKTCACSSFDVFCYWIGSDTFSSIFNLGISRTWEHTISVNKNDLIEGLVLWFSGRVLPWYVWGTWFHDPQHHIKYT